MQKNIVKWSHTKNSAISGKHRNIDVDFNTLDIVFSLQSWVIILDFFGIGSPKPATQDATKKISSNSRAKRISSNVQDVLEFTQEMDVKVKSLSVLLNHSDYEVAKASVTTFQVLLRWGFFLKWSITTKNCVKWQSFIFSESAELEGRKFFHRR